MNVNDNSTLFRVVAVFVFVFNLDEFKSPAAFWKKNPEGKGKSVPPKNYVYSDLMVCQILFLFGETLYCVRRKHDGRVCEILVRDSFCVDFY